MAFTTDYYVEHIADVDGNSRTYRIEILKDGGTGNNTELQGWGQAGVFTLEFERVPRGDLFKGIAQKGRLDLHLAIQNATHLSILTDIIAGDENDYKLRLKEGGTVKWTGFVIPDLISYSIGDYPFVGTITAKDLSLIESEDFETNTAIDYQQYSGIIADLVNATGLNLSIHSYNDWTTTEISDSDDYFNQTYLDKYQLQNFSSFSQGSFEARSKLEVLNEIIPPGFLLRQYNNVWNLFSIDYLARNGSSATRYEYNTSGTKTGSTSAIDLTEDVDRVDNYLLGTSVNKPWPGLKQLRLEFNHKTSIQNLLFESEYVHTDVNDTSSEELKVSDTTSRIVDITGQVEVTTDTNPGSTRQGNAELLIQVDDYELSLSTGSWGLNTGSQQVSVNGSDNTLTGQFTVRSADIPVAVEESTLTVEFRWATVSGETVTQVKWHNIQCQLINGDDVDQAAAKKYRLTQSGVFSSRKTVPTIIVGQGPDDESNSAIRYNNAGQFDQVTQFSQVGGTAYQYEQFVLQNLMNLQRGNRESIDANLLALYNPRNLLVYDSTTYLFLDGVLNGYDASWNGTMVELNWQTGSDTFEEFVKIGAGDSGATIAVSSGSASTSKFDSRYLNEADNLGDLNNVDTALTNLSLKDGTKALDLLSVDIVGQTFVDQHRNVVGAVGTFFEGSGQIEAADVPSEILSVIIAGGVSDSPVHGWFQARAPDSDTWHPFALSPKGGGVVIGDTSMSGYTGLRVVGTAAITSTLDIDTIGELTADAGVTIDGLLVKDGSIPQAAVTEHEAAINHDALANFVADEHIDWTLPAFKDIHDDNIPSSAVTQYEILIDHDNLFNFVANEHLDWTVSVDNEIHLDNIPNLTAGQITNGTFADDRISQSSVTQYEAALTITESQITDGSLLARLAANETITGFWTFESAVLVKNNIESRASVPQYRWRETDGAADEKQYGAYVENGELIYETQTDISESRDVFMKVTRTGTDVDPVDFPAGVRQTHNHIFERF